MAIDYSVLALPKGKPRILESVEKEREDTAAWDRCVDAVDQRDGRVCQVSGKFLAAGAVDPWLALERNHIVPRSLSKGTRYNPDVVLTMSRAVHQLWHAGAFWLKDKAGKKARRVSQIDYLEWNPRIVPPKDPRPFTVRKGLPVRKD